MESPGTQQFDLNDADPHSSSEHESKEAPSPLQLMITRPHELESCPFWVSLYGAGSATPQDLFAAPSIEGIFHLLSQRGLKEKQPLMLSENTLGKTPRQFFLVPELLCKTEPERICEIVVTTLEALCPVKVGLFFASDKIGIRFATELIEDISLGLSFLRTKELHLYTGEIGVNPLLNTALRVKSKLEGRREVFVYH